MNHGVGPIPSRIMLVGEAYGESEDKAKEPFVGPSGQELNRMLSEAGIMRSECYTTNVVNARPPGNDITAWIALKKKDVTSAHIGLRDKMVLPIIAEGTKQLFDEIELVKPNIIVAFGNVALWALTGKWGILKWRGSQLRMNGGYFSEHLEPKVIPVLHPAAILREWSARATAVNDLRRVKRHMASRYYDNVPKWEFMIRPSFASVMSTLHWLERSLDNWCEIERPHDILPKTWDRWIDFDLETSIKYRYIKCVGLSWSKTEALCIPIWTENEDYWSLEEEAAIVRGLYKLLTHPNVKVRGQNLLFDCQYTYREWHFIPRVAQDTMIAHHVCFAGLRKSLDFQASMYCDYYVQWKPDKSSWKEGG